MIQVNLNTLTELYQIAYTFIYEATSMHDYQHPDCGGKCIFHNKRKELSIKLEELNKEIKNADSTLTTTQNAQ